MSQRYSRRVRFLDVSIGADELLYALAAHDKMKDCPHMQQPQKIQVLIANDQSLVREGLAAVLNHEKQMEVVAQTGKLSQVLEHFRTYRPSVLLIDLRLGGSDTIETIKKIHEDFPSAAILMVSGHDGSEIYIVHCAPEPEDTF